MAIAAKSPQRREKFSFLGGDFFVKMFAQVKN
jgi:hypothetical protein